MSYAAWSASLIIPHIQQQQAAATAAGTVLPASASLRIEYECSCGRLHPHLAYLFWCKQCSALQCQQCTQQQVDTYFCPACLNSVFTTPAFANQNRCEQCVECPSCFHILSPSSRPSGSYAYLCEFCHWCSEDYSDPVKGLKSPLIASESNLLAAKVKETEQNMPVQQTFHQLLSYYRTRTAGSALSKSGASPASVAQARKQQVFEQFESLLASSDASNPLIAGVGGTTLSRVASLSLSSAKPPDSAGLEASNVARWMAWREDREKMLHDLHYTLPTDPVTNEFERIPQEFLGYFDEANPRRKGIEESLQTKLAHRCKTCNKYLVKPGPGASKQNMEIHLAAFLYIPTITIGQFRPLRVDRKTSIILYFKNRVEKSVKLWLTLPTDEEEMKKEQEKFQKESESKGTRVVNLLDASPPPSRFPAPTASLEFIRAAVTIAAYDEIPEENANWQEDGQKIEEEPMLVVFRQLSKVGLLLHVTPQRHDEATHFVLLVHMQTSSPSAASSTSGSSDATAGGGGEIITFPVHINLGYAQT